MYVCPQCGLVFDYSPNYEREAGHCGHECLSCGTVMIWDEPDGPRKCSHRNLERLGSVLPKKEER